MSVSSYVNGLFTWLGFETKENIKEKLINTNEQLNKAVVVIKNNEENDRLNNEANTAKEVIYKEYRDNETNIKESEWKALEEIFHTKEPTIDTSIEEKKETVKVIKDKSSNELSGKQKKQLEVLYNRSLLIKGAKNVEVIK